MRYYELSVSMHPADSQDARDLLSALLAEIGFETFEDTPEGLNAYIQQQLCDEAAIAQVFLAFPIPEVTMTHELREASYENWNEQWESEGFEPIVIADAICIHDTRHAPSQPFAHDITINPRMAFGSGTHPTTQLMLSALLDADLTGKRVMDAGCGTGVLGILCMQLGAAQVIAYDIDEWSTENAELNYALNGFNKVDIRLGDCHVAASESGLDVILANINRNILLADLPTWRKTLSDGGEIRLSGFYEHDAEAILQLAATLGLKEKQRLTKDEWCLLVLG